MDNQNTIYVSLAGCGKTYQLVKIAKKKLNEGYKMLYLSFNRKIRYEIITKHGFPKNIIHTFHSLAYNDNGGKKFIDTLLPDYDSEEIQEIIDNKSEYYKELLEWWLNNTEESKYNDIQYIFVDEFQDLDNTMMRMLIKLYEINNKRVTFYVAGDNYQTIYNFLNKKKPKDNFKKIKKYFSDFQTIELTKNYRSSPSILKFINGFYELHYEDNRCFDLTEYAEDEYTDDVYIHMEQNRQTAIDRVANVFEKYPHKSIMLLCYTKNEVKECIKRYGFRDNIRINTIHKEKGNEADICIVLNTQFNNEFKNEPDFNVWNVGISRGKEKLHIISSFKSKDFLKHFKQDTYIFENNQHTCRSRSNYKVNLSIDTDIHLTFEKMSKSVIDSIIIEIDYSDCPFIPFEKQNLEKRSNYKTSTQMNYKNLKYVLHRNNGKLSFDFRDLNPLKNMSFTDDAILQFITGAISDYFSHQISEATILKLKIKRLDLAILSRVTSSHEVIGHITNLFNFAKSNTNSKRYIKNIPEIQTKYLNCKIDKYGDSGVIYLNGIKIYDPSNKECNILEDSDNVIKLEIYKCKGSDPSKKSNKLLNMTVGELFKVVEDNKIKELFYEWLYYEFPYCKERPVKNISLQIKKRKINNIDDLMNRIKHKKMDIRDKRMYFYIYLHFLKDIYADEIRKIFKIKNVKRG